MAKLAYKDMLRDEEVEDFIRTYCRLRGKWHLDRGETLSHDLWKKVPCWWLNTDDRGSVASPDLKVILKEILKADRRAYHTWRSPEEMRMWFDMNRDVAKS